MEIRLSPIIYINLFFPFFTKKRIGEKEMQGDKPLILNYPTTFFNVTALTLLETSKFCNISKKDGNPRNFSHSNLSQRVIVVSKQYTCL